MYETLERIFRPAPNLAGAKLFLARRRDLRKALAADTASSVLDTKRIMAIFKKPSVRLGLLTGTLIVHTRDLLVADERDMKTEVCLVELVRKR